MILSSLGAFAVTAVLFTNCSQTNFTAVTENNGQVRTSEIGDKGDPLIDFAWHLNNTGQRVYASQGGTAGVDLNLVSVWKSGIYGKGVRILVSDDGVEDLHEDLVANYLYQGSKDYRTGSRTTARPDHISDNHGTAVAGLISATAGNGYGSAGVAPLSMLANTNFLAHGVSQLDSVVAEQASKDFDVVNMSWGNSQNGLPNPVGGYFASLLAGVTSGRGGKGTIFVKAAGNDFSVTCHKATNKEQCLGNANFDPDNSTPYTILTAAVNANGEAASYSSSGANIWVSSFGGEYGTASPAMMTTDRSGCEVGFSNSTATSRVTFEKGTGANESCNYSVVFNGTSSAAPVLSGAIALILEANPNLTWRDVKYILAKTAVPSRSSVTSINHQLGLTVPSGAVWEQGWVTNKAGFKFHNWYGFGRVNVAAAVTLAKSYGQTMPALTATSPFTRADLSRAIPDNSAVGVTDTVYVNSNLKIEGVRLTVSITHADISELAIELTSPQGTKSIIVNMRNSLTGISGYQGETFLSNAFYQELATGNWTIKVIDGVSGRTGTLTNWSLSVYGSN